MSEIFEQMQNKLFEFTLIVESILNEKVSTLNEISSGVYVVNDKFVVTVTGDTIEHRVL